MLLIWSAASVLIASAVAVAVAALGPRLLGIELDPPVAVLLGAVAGLLLSAPIQFEAALAASGARAPEPRAAGCAASP